MYKRQVLRVGINYLLADKINGIMKDTSGLIHRKKKRQFNVTVCFVTMHTVYYRFGDVARITLLYVL